MDPQHWSKPSLLNVDNKVEDPGSQGFVVKPQNVKKPKSLHLTVHSQGTYSYVYTTYLVLKQKRGVDRCIFTMYSQYTSVLINNNFKR